MRHTKTSAEGMGISSTAFSSKVWLNMTDPAALYRTPKQAWQASGHVWRPPPHCEGTVDLFITVRTLFLGSFVQIIASALGPH